MSKKNKIRLDYGRDGLEVQLDPSWNYKIIKPQNQKAFKNPIARIRDSIKSPINSPSLERILQKKGEFNHICIVVSDATRPVPSKLILRALISELKEKGVPDEKIIILVATGLHRPSREDELLRIIGKEFLERFKVIDHVAIEKKSLVKIKIIDQKIPILINRFFIESDVKILTGYVEPHFFFGFSGGRKAVIPGLAGKATILKNHSAKNIDSKYSRFGIYKKNPMHLLTMKGIENINIDFIVNVCINEDHEIIQVASGDLEKTHESLVNYQLKNVFKEISEPFDIVICGNGGYPLDLNLYQAVKSMAIGEIAVKKGGTIISVNECSDGIGIGQDNFRELIFSRMRPEEIYQKILNQEIVVPDLWEIMILVRIMMKADVFVISRLKEEDLGNIGLKYAKSVEEAIKLSLKKHGPNSKILILPNGPQILPKLI